MSNLMKGLHDEIVRCRELKKQYEAIGPAGTFGTLVLKSSIENAEAALESGDAVDMTRALADLKLRE